MYLCHIPIWLRVMNLKSRAKTIYKEIIFRLSASNSILYTSFYRNFYTPSPGTIAEFTSLFSKSREKITVVQIGANDGIHNDPIHRFIKRDNWHGVLLEPQKYVFEKYLSPLYKKTNGIVTLNAALDVKDGSKPVYKISFSNSRWAHGLTSFNRSVIEEAVRSGYVARQAIKEGSILPEKPEDYIEEEQVECISTQSLVKRFRLDKIDWLQIDTEGFDFEIIMMFNIKATNPEVIVYENLHFPDKQKEDCLSYLRNNGYLCRNYGPNTLAMRAPATGFERFFNSEK
jgi:FkbM family methyltransferase